MKLTLVLSSIARSVILTATSRPPGSFKSGRSNPFLTDDEFVTDNGVPPCILQGFVPVTPDRPVERLLLLRLTTPSLAADLSLLIDALRESTTCSSVPETSQASQTLLNDPWPRVRRRVSETEVSSSHAEIIDPGYNDLVLVTDTRRSSLDGRCGFVGRGVARGGGDGSYSDPARDTEGVGNMPIDSDNGALRSILFDGDPSVGMKDGVELRPVDKIRGVLWSGRGVFSAEVSSWEWSYSTNVRVDECLGESSREVCLDGKKRDRGGSGDILLGDDLSE